MKNRDEPVILIAAGGSGGHVYPALAVAEEFVHRNISTHVVLDQRGSVYTQSISRIRAGDQVASPMSIVDYVTEGESRRSTNPKLKRRRVSMSAARPQLVVHIFKGTYTHPEKWLRPVIRALYSVRAWIQAVRLLHTLKPDVVVGFGGFATFPILVAALMLGYPYMLHEQNAILGKVNRLFARYARSIAVSYKNTQRLPKKFENKTVETGMPTRHPLAAVSRDHPYCLPTRSEKLTLFVFGGSQGAHSFDETVPKTIALMPADKRARLHIIQQSRSDLSKKLEAHYAELGVTAEVAPFFNAIASCYAQAHVVLCRAGASSIAELKVTGRPAILIPYPWAADNHQWVNAYEIEMSSAGWVIPQERFTPRRLLALLLSLLEHPQTLLYAAESMQCLATKKAHILLADVIETYVREEKRYGLIGAAQS